MRFMIHFTIPTEAGNEALKDPDFGKKMQELLRDLKPEAAYFTARHGHRGGYIVLDMKDDSEMPAIAEPFFLWLKATVEFFPCMTPEDLGKAAPSIAAAVKKWG
jgi:hypothetical protein